MLPLSLESEFSLFMYVIFSLQLMIPQESYVWQFIFINTFLTKEIGEFMYFQDIMDIKVVRSGEDIYELCMLVKTSLLGVRYSETSLYI